MIGDFPFPPGPEMHLNPFGPEFETLLRAKRILTIINNSALKTVCGCNYICGFNHWLPDFERAIKY
jgi:hypothetical protein